MAEPQSERVRLMQLQLNRSRRGRTHAGLAVLLAALACAAFSPAGALAAPSAEIARKCMQYSYVAYPYKRPGSVRMSGDRQAYFRDCVAKEGNIPVPEPPKS
jgi:hypothetical protein